jgi:U4/U6 small nuclear ribonucleoprotein PRP4
MDPPKDRIYFGSIEVQAKERMQQQGDARSGDDDSGDEDVPMRDLALLPFSAKTEEEMKKQQEMLNQLEMEKKAREIVVPTSDELVIERLRELEEPIILFGETKPERRARLKKVLVSRGITEGMPAAVRVLQATHGGGFGPDEAWFYEGTDELLEARKWILNYSLNKAKERIASEKAKKDNKTGDAMVDVGQEDGESPQSKERLYTDLKKFTQNSSEVGDERTVSSCSFSPDGSHLTTCSWNNLIKVWDVETLQCVKEIRAHKERISHVSYYPYGTPVINYGVKPEETVDSTAPRTLDLASCAADSTVKLWNSASGTHLATLTGHNDRVCRMAWHPSGRYMGTTSFDMTWMLWDLETGKCILEQEGHYKPVYAIAFQGDGSLVATGGLDSIARLWDLRSGKPIWNMRGHVKQILAVDWAPNGYQVLTGSDDHTLRIWDLRKKSSLYIIPAHTSLISSARYQPKYGNYVLSSSYDKTIKLWSMQDFSLIKELKGHGDKVTHVELSPRSSEHSQAPAMFASTSFDLTWKTWKIDHSVTV